MAKGSGRKRYGARTSDPIDNEKRFLAIENELVKKRHLDNSDPNSTTRRVLMGAAPPQVIGVRLVKNVGTINIFWSPLNISNLSYYEIQIASSTNFHSATIRRVTDPFYTFQEGSPGTVYYVRIRGVINNQQGLYSTTVNSLTGQASSTNLSNNSANSLVEEILTGSPIASLVVNDGGTLIQTVLVGSASITTSGGVISPKVITSVVVSTTEDFVGSGVDSTILIELLRDPGSVVVSSSSNDIQSIATSANLTIAGFTEYDDPTAGTYTYRVRSTLSVALAGGTATVNINRNVIQLLEYVTARTST